MATENNGMKKMPRALQLIKLAAILSLAACDPSAPDINGNSTAIEGISGSQPRTSLTFATDPNLANNGHSAPGEGALRSTLSSTTATSFDDLQVLVFGPMCSGCHMGGGISQPSVMDMTTADASYAALVTEPATSSPMRTLVIPGDAANSYMINSLEGTQTSGSRMPMRSAPLSDDLMTALRTWINNGAPR